MGNTKRYISLLLITLISLNAWPADLAAQEDAGGTKEVASGTRQTMLVLGGGLGQGKFRDDGTAPFAYKGLLLPTDLGLKWLGKRGNSFSIISSTSVGVYRQAMAKEFSLDAYDVFNTFRIKLERGIDNYSIGLSLTNFLDATVNPSYENAAVGVSDFFGLELSVGARVRTDQYFKGKFWSNKAVHGEFVFMPVAGVVRPGYAYIDNYTSTNNVVRAQFSDYNITLQPFAAMATDVGFDIFPDQFSKISFSYRWSFHMFDKVSMHLDENYGGSSPFRHAYHTLVVDFFINLKSK